MDIIHPELVAEAVSRAVIEEPETVAEARLVVANPQLALHYTADERQLAWTLLLAAKRQGIVSPRSSGTAA